MDKLLDKIPAPILIGVLTAAGVLLVITFIAKNLLYICKPNEILIFSGGKRTAADGRDVGFRVKHGGRGVRIPVIESVVRMDVSNISVNMSVQGAYSEGGIPLSVTAVANVKVSTDPRYMGNAIERFLGSRRDRARRQGDAGRPPPWRPRADDARGGQRGPPQVRQAPR